MTVVWLRIASVLVTVVQLLPSRLHDRCCCACAIHACSFYAYLYVVEHVCCLCMLPVHGAMPGHPLPRQTVAVLYPSLQTERDLLGLYCKSRSAFTLDCAGSCEHLVVCLFRDALSAPLHVHVTWIGATSWVCCRGCDFSDPVAGQTFDFWQCPPRSTFDRVVQGLLSTWASAVVSWLCRTCCTVCTVCDQLQHCCQLSKQRPTKYAH